MNKILKKTMSTIKHHNFTTTDHGEGEETQDDKVHIEKLMYKVKKGPK